MKEISDLYSLAYLPAIAAPARRNSGNEDNVFHVDDVPVDRMSLSLKLKEAWRCIALRRRLEVLAGWIGSVAWWRVDAGAPDQLSEAERFWNNADLNEHMLRIGQWGP